MRFAVLALLLVAPCALGQESPRFVVRTTSGPLPAVRITSWDDDGVLHLESGVTVAPGEFVELRRVGRKRPAPPAPPFVQLTTGDRFALDPAGNVKLEDGRLHATFARPLQSAKDTPANLFLPYVAQIFMRSWADEDDAIAGAASKKNDVVLQSGGERIEGRLAKLDQVKGAVVVDGKRTLTVPWEQFAGATFAIERQAKVRSKKSHLLAVLGDGARVHFAQLRFDAKKQTWVGKTLFGLPLELPADYVVALQSLGGRAVYLSELAPVRQEQTPYLGVAWPMRLDTGASGQPLRLGGEWRDRGVGMHAQSSATFKLDGKYAWFEAAVGMDDAVSPRSRAKAAVLIDGKRHALNEGREMKLGDAPIEVRLEVRGAKELTLVTEFGSFGDVRADLDWADARLLKAE
jgi:hypothetical protein